MFDQEYWYKKTEKKFLHNIDSFYFSVKLYNDFTYESNTMVAQNVRKMVDSYSQQSSQDEILFQEVFFEKPLYYHHITYGRFYTFNLRCNDMFDFFFAPFVPKNAAGESVTSEIHVQIRSELLWSIGPKLAYDKAFSFVQAFCKKYSLTIKEIKENRSDFCWHTNYFQNPEKVFSPEYIAANSTGYLGRNRSGMKNLHTINEFDSDGNLSVNYVSLGKRGEKCFLRIYHKTQEVIEKGYKSWFFYHWLFNGLINRYDLYLLEKAYQMRNYAYIQYARLQFIREYLSDNLSQVDAALIEQYLSSKTMNYTDFKKLADKYTPAPTKIYNIEFQVMRKMSKSFELIPFKENTGIHKRIYDYLDNRKLITNYLTKECFRMIKHDDSNKSRCSNTDFWERLRNCKQIDTPSSHDLKLIRKYSSNLDLSIRKKKAVRAISNFALAVTQNPDMSIYEDAAELLATLNDNDLEDIYNYKKEKVINLPDDVPDSIKYKQIKLIDYDSGEVL